MSRPAHPARPGLIRPLAPYEPPVTRHNNRRESAGQLPLPLPLRAAADEDTRRTQAPATPTPRPSSRELAAWLTALIEVAAGRRSQARVSQLLSERLSTEIRSAAVAELGCTYAFTRVHHCEPAPRLLEVCATAHDRRHGRALAVVARLEAGWTGWRFTRFAVIGPTRRGGSGRVSAA